MDSLRQDLFVLLDDISIAALYIGKPFGGTVIATKINLYSVYHQINELRNTLRLFSI
jgi:hypothetical protein